MSPEQARGQAVDKRTDIWAFGCVLYEMLTGRAAFARETVSDTIAAILEREPDWTALPPTTPPYVSRLLERCLEKDPTRRLRDIGDARVELVAGDDDAGRRGRERDFRSTGAGGSAARWSRGRCTDGRGVRPRRFPASGGRSACAVTPVRFSVSPPQGSMFFHNVGDDVPRPIAGRIAVGVRRRRASRPPSDLAPADLRPRGAGRARHRGRSVGLLVA